MIHPETVASEKAPEYRSCYSSHKKANETVPQASTSLCAWALLHIIFPQKKNTFTQNIFLDKTCYRSQLREVFDVATSCSLNLIYKRIIDGAFVILTVVLYWQYSKICSALWTAKWMRLIVNMYRFVKHSNGFKKIHTYVLLPTFLSMLYYSSSCRRLL